MTLETQNVRAIYPGRRKALAGVTCAVRPGRVTAIVGPNGSGKSTLLRLLAGVLTPESGTVLLDGSALADRSARDRARRVALVAQRPTVAFDYDVRRVVGFGAEGSCSDPSAADRAIERFGLEDVLDVPFGSLSVGQQQRVSIARAWAQLDARPDAFFLADEPVSAMDPKHVSVALDAFRDLASHGAGVGLVLHDLSAAARLADDCVLLDADGSLDSQGPSDDLLTSERLSALYGTPIVRSDAPGVGPVLAPPMNQPAASPGPGSPDA